MSAKRQRAQTNPTEEEEDEADEEDEEEQAEEGEEEEEIESDEEGELSLQVDEDGRVCSSEGVLTSSMCLDPAVRVFDAFVPEQRVAALRDCCEKCFKVKPSKGRYSSGTTFWADWDQKPRCELEALALAILRRHCPRPAASAGVEWWTLCLDTDADVAWHWDRDYVLEDSGVNIHPMLSTVTYLSSPSPTPQVSTLTLDVLSPPARDPAQPVSLDACGAMAACTVVPPRPGRHLVFDGRYLHGAPPLASSIESADAGVKRVTFLANIWVGHKPGNASPLPAELQGWSKSGDGEAAWKELDAVLTAAPALAAPIEVAISGSAAASCRRAPKSFPLEGGALKVVLPAAPRDGDRFAVLSSLVPVSWARSGKRKKRGA